MRDDALLQVARVLVVEDNWQVATALKAALTDIGMMVLGPAGAINDARRLASEEKPELALVDLNLHGEMAFDLVDWLLHRGLRVVVTSGLAVLPGFARQDVAFLQKPFGTDELMMAMRQVLGKKMRDDANPGMPGIGVQRSPRGLHANG